jgi:inner membrane protein
MQGDQHVLISVLSAGLMLAPWLSAIDPLWTVLLLAGVFIGSLAPDADAADAAIMHGLRGGRGLLRRLRRHTVLTLPAVGYTIRYLIYYPLSALVWFVTLGRVRPQHRGFLHSLFGILLTTACLIGYLWLILAYFGVGRPIQLAVFGAGFLAGCLLHLVEDSCTRSGICWWYPLSSRRVRGNIAAGGRRERRPELFGSLIGGCTLVLLIAEPLLGVSQTAAAVVSLLLLPALWGAFLATAGLEQR